MKPDQFKAALARLGWTRPVAARELGLSIRTLTRYASGQSRIPYAVERLLLIKSTRPARPPLAATIETRLRAYDRRGERHGQF